MALQQNLLQFQQELDQHAAEYFDEKVGRIISSSRHIGAIIREAEAFVRRGGKRLRPFLLVLGYQAAGGAEVDKARKTSLFLELIHQYLVCHDDIIDRDLVRRGNPTLHASYRGFGGDNPQGEEAEHRGISLGILAGDLLSTYGNELVATAPFAAEVRQQVSQELSSILIKVVEGQALDILYPTLTEELTEEEVLRVAQLKTAAYTVEGPLRLGAVLGEASAELLEELHAYAEPLGVAFQIKDDILGIFGDSSQTGKSVESDLREGKRTLLVWHAQHVASEDDRAYLARWLGDPSLEAEQAAYIRELMLRSGTLEYAENKVRSLLLESRKALSKAVHIVEPIRDALDEFSLYIMERRS